MEDKSAKEAPETEILQNIQHPKPVEKTTQTNPPMPSNLKWLLIGGLLTLLVLSTFFGLYLLSKRESALKLTSASNVTPSISNSNINATSSVNTSSWKTYTNTNYGISFNYPSTWYPQDVTNIAPAKALDAIDLFPNGATPSVSSEGNPGNELLNLYIFNPTSGGEPITETKEQFLAAQNKIGNKITTVSGHPAGYLNEAYDIWYNDKIEISIYSNSKIGQSYFDRIISTLKFADQISLATPTPESFPDWNRYSDSKYNFSFKYPTDWTTQVKDYPENNQRLINIIKNSDPGLVSLSFTISNNWDNTGNAKDQPKNFSVGAVAAYRLDPPKPTEQTLERYQTNVYFESPDGHVYVFACTHNWNQDYINTCNNILSTVKFTQ